MSRLVDFVVSTYVNQLKKLRKTQSARLDQINPFVFHLSTQSSKKEVIAIKICLFFCSFTVRKKCKVNAKNNVRPTVKMIGVFMRALRY